MFSLQHRGLSLTGWTDRLEAAGEMVSMNTEPSRVEKAKFLLLYQHVAIRSVERPVHCDNTDHL